MRTLIADDQANVRSALVLLLEEEPQFEIVGEAADAAATKIMVVRLIVLCLSMSLRIIR